MSVWSGLFVGPKGVDIPRGGLSIVSEIGQVIGIVRETTVKRGKSAGLISVVLVMEALPPGEIRYSEEEGLFRGAHERGTFDPEDVLRPVTFVSGESMWKLEQL